MNKKSVKFAYLVKEWGENYPPKQEYIKRLAQYKVADPIGNFAVIWQVYGKPDDLYFKAFCYSILSSITHSNILSYNILVYISPCFLLDHRSIIEALRLLGVRFIPIKYDIFESKYYILRNFLYDYDKIMLIDCDAYLTGGVDFSQYWKTSYALSGDELSEEQRKWAVWPKLIEIKTGMSPEAYLDIVYEHFSNKYTRDEFDIETNYIGDFLSAGHLVVSKELYKNEDFVGFLKWSSINGIKADDLTIQIGARLVKMPVGYNAIPTVSNASYSEAIKPSIHLNGLTFDKYPEWASIFTRILNN